MLRSLVIPDNRVLGWQFAFAILALLSTSAMAQEPWKVVWQDEFDGKSLDYSKWECEVNAFGGGNQELQMYTDRKENVRVEEGHLIIEARKDQPNIVGTIREYSSGRIRSKHRGDWQYGRFEISAKLPKGQGMWPAIWMLPTEEKYGPWASSGEIDIMEYRGQTINEVLGTLHFGSPWPKNEQTHEKPYQLKDANFADAFHRFALEWEEGVMRWYVDDELMQTVDKWRSDGGAFPAPFDQPFHLIINLAVGGQFVGPVDDTTTFPQQLSVDYVRVYQRK